MPVIVRHGRSLPDPAIAADDWPLDPAGHAAIAELADRLRSTVVVCSGMRRAVETARYFGPPTVDPRLAEVSRPFVTQLEARVRTYFAGHPVEGWEPQSEAIARFDASLAQHGEAVYVTHGTVMSLYVASRCRRVDAYAFWAGLRNPDAWTFENGQPRRVV
ncbi:MAG: histidine phosphatase family protein [Microbacteriaceae bacterium]